MIQSLDRLPPFQLASGKDNERSPNAALSTGAPKGPPASRTTGQAAAAGRRGTAEGKDAFDVVIVGGGPGGYVAAIRAGQLGLRTALVEKDDRLGGTCLLRGCIPTKSLLWTAELFAHLKEGGQFGINAADASVDWSQAQRHKDGIVAKGVKGIDYLMKKNKIEVISGKGRLLGGGVVEVTGDNGAVTVSGKNIVLATGSAQRHLPNVPVDHKTVLDSDSILELDHIPKRLIVLGGGAVGCEFASVFNDVGSDVTLVELQPRLLAAEDEDISKEVGRAFRRRGIKTELGAGVERVEVTEAGARVFLKTGDQTRVLEADVVLSALGRQPVTGDVGLEATNIQTARGFIKTDGNMQTTEPNIYAIGDIVSTPMLAHVASAEGIQAVSHIAGLKTKPLSYDEMPAATYGRPEVASVGLTEKKARELGHDVRVGKFPFSANLKAAMSNESQGFVKFVVGNKYDEILGVHMVGPKVTELIGEAAAAMRLESTPEELALSVHPHPTLNEIVKEAAEAADGKAIHI